MTVAFLFSAAPLTAQETSANFGSAGSITIGDDNRVCDTSNTEGSFRYNAAQKVIEYCNGTEWVENEGVATPLFTLCAGVSDHHDVGSACDDGSIYLALYYDQDLSQHIPLYATDSDQSTGIQWKTSTGSNDISTDSSINGQDNHDNRSGSLANFPAFELCQNLTRHGHSDWYLPAEHELRKGLFSGGSQDRVPGLTLSTNDYWSSTEDTTTEGQAVD